MATPKTVTKDAAYWNKITSALKKTHVKTVSKPTPKESSSKVTKK